MSNPVDIGKRDRTGHLDTETVIDKSFKARDSGRIGISARHDASTSGRSTDYRMRSCSNTSLSSTSSDREHFAIGQMSPFSQSPETRHRHRDLTISLDRETQGNEDDALRHSIEPIEERGYKNLDLGPEIQARDCSLDVGHGQSTDLTCHEEDNDEEEEIQLGQGYTSTRLPVEEFAHMHTGELGMAGDRPSDVSASPRGSAFEFEHNEATARPTISSFTTLGTLGQGSFGKVYLVRKKSSSVLYAMKVLRKASIILRGPKTIEHTRSERVVLEQIQHPFIVKLYWAFQTMNKLCLVLEYAAGGELFSYLAFERIFTEKTTAFFMGQLVLALEHLHSFGILYRDLKPENILLDRDGYARLCDFGLCKTAVDDGARAHTSCGTTEYLAPEVILHAKPDDNGNNFGQSAESAQRNPGYGYEADWYSLGAVMHDCLTGSPPFTANNRRQTIEAILTKKLTLNRFPHLSSDAKSILSGLLRRDPRARLGAHRKPVSIMESGSAASDVEYMRNRLDANQSGPSKTAPKRTHVMDDRSGSSTPTQRAKSPAQYSGAEAVKRHAFFKRNITSFEALLQKKIQAPLIPVLTSTEVESRGGHLSGMDGQSPDDHFSAHGRTSSSLFGGFSYVAAFASSHE